MSGGKQETNAEILGPQEFACGPIYALELAMNNHARYIKTRADVVAVWFHWCLLRNGFYFFGGELTHNDFHSETLPPNLGFNGDRRAYVLKYGKGVMPYVVGFYLKGQGIDISFVSLYRSLRLNIGIEDLVDDCLNLQDDVVQQLTMLVDEELIKPMQLEDDDDDGDGDGGDGQDGQNDGDGNKDDNKNGGGGDDPNNNNNQNDNPNDPNNDKQSTESGIQTDQNQLPQSAQTLVSQQRAWTQLLRSSTRAVQTNQQQQQSAGGNRGSAPQTLLAVSNPIQHQQQNFPTLVPPPRRSTPFTRRPADERYRIQRAPIPNNQGFEGGELRDEEIDAPIRGGLRKRRGYTGCCG